MSKFESFPIVQKFQQQQNKLSADSCKLIAGISGGPDSMALLYIMHRLNVDVTAVHCNYQVRGEASEKDQQLVEEVCKLWSIECVSVRLEPEEKGSENFQLWARNRRYSIFRDLKKEIDAEYIVTAHHLDDQLETILQKILRGSGISAWAGMKILDGELFRPLLKTDKSEIMQFVQAQNVPYRIDSSNEESTYARNFLRHQWFPALNDLFPGWKENILKLPARAREFDAMTEYLFSSISEKQNIIYTEPFIKLPEEIQVSMLFKLFEKNLQPEEVSDGLLREAMKIKDLQTGKSIAIGENYLLHKDRERFILQEKNQKSLYQTIQKIEIIDGREIAGLQFKRDAFQQNYEPETLSMDDEKIEYPIIIRSWKDGDFFQPLGMNGTQTVSDHLVNRKIDSSEKKKALVIESFDGTICAVIFPHLVNKNEIGTISEKLKCTEQTKHSLTVQKTN